MHTVAWTALVNDTAKVSCFDAGVKKLAQFLFWHRGSSDMSVEFDPICPVNLFGSSWLRPKLQHVGWRCYDISLSKGCSSPQRRCRHPQQSPSLRMKHLDLLLAAFGNQQAAGDSKGGNFMEHVKLYASWALSAIKFLNGTFLGCVQIFILCFLFLRRL